MLDFVSYYDFPTGFLNCSGGVVLFCELFWWCGFVLWTVLVVWFCFLNCSGGVVLFFELFWWCCFVFWTVLVVWFCFLNCSGGVVLFFELFWWCCFVLWSVLVVWFCFLNCSGGVVLFLPVLRCRTYKWHTCGNCTMTCDIVPFVSGLCIVILPLKSKAG